MAKRFPEYKQLDLYAINREFEKLWEEEKTFEKSVNSRSSEKPFVFFEGPPSANGTPGIHHVMARAIKDVVCRYKTLQGYRVDRKAGWDTHGLPVELSVEKTLGITKEDIGKTITVKEYNNTCRKEVMKYTDQWEELTKLMGYWVDMDNPYVTYDNRYIETLWFLLKKLFDKDLLYKGYSIQPFSPAAGTGLSTHELNQPGCYKDVKDTTVVALFKTIRNQKSEHLYNNIDTDLSILAWTTTPWTLPSNTALAVGSTIKYFKVRTFNPYSGKPITVIICKDRFPVYFKEENQNLSFNDYKTGDKNIPHKIIAEYSGSELEGVDYEQLIPWVKTKKPAFRIICGDFVTTEDGTGIVHIAPTFGADDDRVAKQSGIPPLIVEDKKGNVCPLVDRTGKFFLIEDLHQDFVNNYVIPENFSEFTGKFVKNEYDTNATDADETTDVKIAVMLKTQDKAFKIEKYIHNYPHCWRTDKPVLYYPLDSWFIKTTAIKDRMIELNKTINWKPASTGEGRFGKWLENLVDWNLSRSRYWGTPLPIWCTKDKKHIKCIGSAEELIKEINIAVEKGTMTSNPWQRFVPGDYSSENYEKIDLHRPDVDDIVLVAENGEEMYREADLIDVWFDSGAMPYAQWHWPFENSEKFDKLFPADFIAEGVDQTRGWFFTLHAIATMVSDSVSFKNIISNGLVLDKDGNKMSKRLNNAVDPFKTIEEYGADALRWYMITNAQAWDNLKFDINGVDEVKRKFFGTLHNTYNFFALYANIDNFSYSEEEIEVNKRQELDKWILSLLNSLVKDVINSYENYENTRAGRLIQTFVTDHLSNWYVRLGRKRYWGGEYDEDKISAYQTLYTCLITVAKLASPIAPFYTDKLYRDLIKATGKDNEESVHLSEFPTPNTTLIDKALEERMEMAQQISSMILSLRRKVSIKVRQPLNKIVVPSLGPDFNSQIELVSNIILTETNIKELELIYDTSVVLVKKIKPDFKVLGPRYGKIMKQLSSAIMAMDQNQIAELEKNNIFAIDLNGEKIEITGADVEIISEDIPGWLVANEGRLTVALDINITDELRQEGHAREIVNIIQNIRKDSGFDVTDKINILIETNPKLDEAFSKYSDYICGQTIAKSLKITDKMEQNKRNSVQVNDFEIGIYVEKVIND
jgi:isoleucyl-tRNA synthetase